MEELKTSASLVEYATLEGSGAITAVLERSELEAALNADEPAGLWFELGLREDEATTRLTVALTSADVEEMLRLSPGEEVALALDADAVAGLLADPDVEAHGLRGALAIAVATAAIVAPASLAATPQVSAAAATSQASNPAATAQISNAAATAQVRPATRAQVIGLASKAQIKKSLVVRAGGVTLLRRGLAK